MGKIKTKYYKLKEKYTPTVKKWVSFFLNPRFLICFMIGWIFTNGWSYAFFAIGTYFNITWMTVTGAAYMSMLWAPMTPEKIVTFLIAVFLMKRLFPKDEKTLKVLYEELDKAKAALKKGKEKRNAKKQAKRIEKQNKKKQKNSEVSL